MNIFEITASTDPRLTDAEILDVQSAAAQLGDDETVALCERALRGSQTARCEIANMIADGEA